MLRRAGFDVVRFAPEINRPFPVLPLLIRERLASGESLFFVQVGANDGVLDDPLREVVKQNHLPGLLIEPLPDIFAKLKDSYGDQPQLRFENTAITANAEGTIPIYRVNGRAHDVPHHWHGIASLDTATLLAQGVPKKQIERTEVRTATLTSVLAKHAITKVDLLQVDTEGYDFEIVRAALNGGILPAIISYEHCWLVPSIRFRCKEMLDHYGYRFIEAGKDTIAVR